MSKQEIEDAVTASLAAYFEDLGGEEPHALYDLMLPAFEKSLLVEVLAKAGANQSKAAKWLGITRNTLRKKLTRYGL
jgi:Fis family transcriptional regulator